MIGNRKERFSLVCINVCMRKMRRARALRVFSRERFQGQYQEIIDKKRRAPFFEKKSGEILYTMLEGKEGVVWWICFLPKLE